MLTPSYTNAVAGATALNVAGGMSGFAAALAPELAIGRVRGSARRDRRGAGQSRRRRVSSRPRVGRARRGLAHHPQLFSALRVLQPDPSGARLPGRGTGRTAAAPRTDRAHRGHDLPLRLGDEEPAAAELFRLEVFAAACRRSDGGARRRRVCRTRRFCAGRSGHRGIASKSQYQRRSGDERSGAASAAGARHPDADRWPAQHQVLR